MKAKSNQRIPGRTWLTAVILLVISSNSCGIFDACDASLMPLYYVDIRAEITVRDNSGNPLAGVTVRVEMQKFHCEGNAGPNLVAQGETASNGVYTSSGSWSFKMSNDEDVIHIKSGINTAKDVVSYKYADLSSYADRTYTYTRNIIRP